MIGDLEYGDDDRDSRFPADRDGATATGTVVGSERDRYRYTGDADSPTVTVRTD